MILRRAAKVTVFDSTCYLRLHQGTPTGEISDQLIREDREKEKHCDLLSVVSTSLRAEHLYYIL